jgi:hypothetical protein
MKFHGSSHAGSGQIYIVLSLLLVVLGCSTTPPGKSGIPSIYWIYPVEKTGTADVHVSLPNSGVVIQIAGNEYEMAQTRIVNDSPRTITITSIETILPSPSISLKLYLLDMIDITRRTRWFDPSSVPGSWPDACIPLALQTVDQGNLWVEPEGIALSPGSSVSVLFEWYAHSGLAESGNVDGALAGRVIVRFQDQPDQALSFVLQPTGFSLPWKPSISTAVGISYNRIMTRHQAFSHRPFDEMELWLRYIQELGEHRLYPYNADPEYFPLDSQDAFDPDAFDLLQGALLDGTLFKSVPPANSIQFRPPPTRLTAEAQLQYYKDVANHLLLKGHSGKLYYYTIDEPLITEYEMIKKNADLYTGFMPGMRVLVTEPYSPLLAEDIDIWCPDILSLGDSFPFFPLFAKGVAFYPDFHYNPKPSVYRSEMEKGKEFWLYTCTSAQILDYPNLFIDSPAAYHRIIPWIMQRYGATGFLYYNTVVAYRKGDPWIDQYDFEANGDGTLFYPGHEGIPFTKSQIPIGSLRMKILRDGFEDYEYLELLRKKRGNAYEANARVFAIARSSLSFEKDIIAIVKAREDLIHALSN